MTEIPVNLRRLVIERAGSRCEYCGLAQVGQEATFHIDHVIPVSADGQTAADNLALACVSCSLRKGARQMSTDPETKQEVELFNPRRHWWIEHFRWIDVHVVGLSSIGRATIDALRINRPLILEIRREEVIRNRHPPEKSFAEEKLPKVLFDRLNEFADEIGRIISDSQFGEAENRSTRHDMIRLLKNYSILDPMASAICVAHRVAKVLG
jgi:hypothetical protein